MKYALGLLELNPLEILGDSLFSRRYCSQVVVPLISTLEADKHVRLTLTATGAAVEYLAESHPLVFKRLRALINEGQIELLCATYTNADWQLFPSYDLRRSHRMTNAVLRKAGLPLKRIMVAQSNPYWPAMASFHEEFDLFVVRDTFLKGRKTARGFPPMARVGDSPLIVAANFLLHDMAARLVSQKETKAIGLFTEGRLDTAVDAWPHSDARFVDIEIGEDHWHWVHSAGAHHFITSSGIRNLDHFFSDPGWMRTVQDFMRATVTDEYEFRLVSEYADAVRKLLPSLPDIGDVHWEHEEGSDRAYWLGAPEQRVRAVLSWTPLSWRSRSALRKAENAVSEVSGPAGPFEEQIEALWRRQLWTEVSPVANRGTLPGEVEFVREHAEHVISQATELCFDLEHKGSIGRGSGIKPLQPSEAPVETEIINGEGVVRWFSNESGIYSCEARFLAEEATCGIGFRLSSDRIAFSSCGYEDEVANIAVKSLDDGGEILLSSTGLYGLGPDIYLIRHNRIVSVGAQAGAEGVFLRFVVDFVPEGRHFEWPFTVVQGRLSTAIAIAQQINAI